MSVRSASFRERTRSIHGGASDAAIAHVNEPEVCLIQVKGTKLLAREASDGLAVQCGVQQYGIWVRSGLADIE